MFGAERWASGALFVSAKEKNVNGQPCIPEADVDRDVRKHIIGHEMLVLWGMLQSAGTRPLRLKHVVRDGILATREGVPRRSNDDAIG